MAEKSWHPLLLSSWRDLETGEEILPGPPAHPESQPLDPGRECRFLRNKITIQRS